MKNIIILHMKLNQRICQIKILLLFYRKVFTMSPKLQYPIILITLVLITRPKAELYVYTIDFINCMYTQYTALLCVSIK